MKKCKWLVPMAILVLAICVGLMGACGKNKKKEPDPVPPPEEKYVSLVIRETTLDLYEDVTLTAETNEATLTWESSDPAVATVQDGKVEAVSEGSAVITARGETASDTCTVTVTDSGEVPVLTVEGESFTLNRKNQKTVNAYVRYKNKTVANAELTASSEDEAVSVSGLTVTGERVGEAEVLVKARWKSWSDSARLTVQVRRDLNVSVAPYDGNLFTKANVGDETYATTVKLTPKIYVDGEEDLHPRVTFVSGDEDIATVAEDGTVTAVDRGETDISMTYAFTDADTQQTQNITVKAPVAVAYPIVQTSVTDTVADIELGRIYYDETQIVGTPVAVSLSGGEERTVTDASKAGFVQLDGKITGAEQPSAGITLFTDEKVGYIFRSSQSYTMLIKSKADLDAFNAHAKKGTKATDLYALGDDIAYDGAWEVICKPYHGDAGEGYFEGTFDGKGHTVSGMTFTSLASGADAAFIGSMKDSGTLKNVTFRGAKLNAANSAGGLVSFTFRNATIENVFVEWASDGMPNNFGYLGALVYRTDGAGLTVRNCGIVSSQEGTGILHCNITMNAEATIENVVAVGGIFADKFTAQDTAFSGYHAYANKDAYIAGMTAELPETLAVGMKNLLGIEAGVYLSGKTELTTKAGENTSLLTALVITECGKLSTETVQWSSDAPQVATVNSTGLVTAVGVGTARITASCGDLTSLPLQITVAQSTVTLTQKAEIDVTQKRVHLKNLSDGNTPLYEGDITRIKIGEAEWNTFATAPSGTIVTCENIGSVSVGTAVTVTMQTTAGVYAFQADPYTMVMSSKADLDEFNTRAKKGTAANEVYVLGDDIAYNGAWEIICKPYHGDAGEGYFEGTFDGKGYTISGMTFTSLAENGADAAFIGSMRDNGTLKNVTFRGAKLNAANSAGGLVSFTFRNATIENVFVEWASDGMPNNFGYLGALVYRTDGAGLTVRNCGIVSSQEGTGVLHCNITMNAEATIENVVAVGGIFADKFTDQGTDFGGYHAYANTDDYKTAMSSLPATLVKGMNNLLGIEADA